MTLFWASLLGYLALAGPYLLATWVAVQSGAGLHSATREAAGWIVEILYLSAATAVISYIVNRKRRAKQHVVRVAQQDSATREQAQRQARRALEQERTARARWVIARMSAHPGGAPDPRAPSGEHLLLALDHASLVEPRVTHRGGPKAQTVVDAGQVIVTDKAIHYRGQTKHRMWAAADLVEPTLNGNARLLLPVRSRTGITGVEVRPEDDLALHSACAWMLALHRSQSLPKLVAHLDAQVAELEAALACGRPFASAPSPEHGSQPAR